MVTVRTGVYIQAYVTQCFAFYFLCCSGETWHWWEERPASKRCEEYFTYFAWHQLDYFYDWCFCYFYIIAEKKRRVKVENAFFFLHREKTDQRETSVKRFLEFIANKKKIISFINMTWCFNASLFSGGQGWSRCKCECCIDSKIKLSVWEN